MLLHCNYYLLLLLLLSRLLFCDIVCVAQNPLVVRVIRNQTYCFEGYNNPLAASNRLHRARSLQLHFLMLFDLAKRALKDFIKVACCSLCSA